MTATVLNTKLNEVEKKIPDHAKYITTPEFNKFTKKKFCELFCFTTQTNKY